MGREIPRDVDSEQAVLGSILIDPDVVVNVEFLKPEHFYLQKHRWIFEQVLRLHKERQAIDLVTVSKALGEHLDPVGGDLYLTELLEAVPSAVHAASYGKIVHDTYLRRRLLESASEIARLAYDEEKDVEEVIGGAEGSVFSVRSDVIDRRTFTAPQLVEQVYANIELAQANKRTAALPTGYPEVDAYLGGFYRQGLYIIAARTGIGKTAWMLNIAQSLAKRGKRVAIFSLEMSASSLAERLMTTYGHVSLKELRTGKIRDENWPGFAEDLGELSKMPIVVDDTPAVPPSYVRAKAMRLQMEQGLDAVFIDYVQLMESDRRAEKRYQEVGYITASLKNLAKELDIPVVTASQLSRAAENREPTLEHLRESGNQEQDADGVVFLYRERAETGEKIHTEAIVAKNRHGPTGTAHLYWVPRRVAYIPGESSWKGY